MKPGLCKPFTITTREGLKIDLVPSDQHRSYQYISFEGPNGEHLGSIDETTIGKGALSRLKRAINSLMHGRSH